MYKPPSAVLAKSLRTIDFIDNYIKPPLKTINEFDTSKLSSIKLTWDNEKIVIHGDTKKYKIDREKDLSED